MPPVPIRRAKLSTGLILMLRHRASNYAMALRNDRDALVTNECRNLLCDLVDPDTVMELTDAWLRQQSRDERAQAPPKGKRNLRRERAANVR